MSGTRMPKTLRHLSEEYLQNNIRTSKQLLEINQRLTVELSLQRNKQRSANDEIGNLRLCRYNLTQQILKVRQEKEEIERLYHIWRNRAKTLERKFCQSENQMTARYEDSTQQPKPLWEAIINRSSCMTLPFKIEFEKETKIIS